MSTILSRANKPAIFFGALLLLMFVLPIASWGQVEMNPEFLGYMEAIAEDMEEIHHDMHKVAFALRLGSYSLVVIAVAQVLLVGTKVFQGKRKE
ncbi:MAG: hypothetical protein EA428_13035 [Spirochaetaceae bacterium]|nr:MAG: hypothetical protein EA428_13035 [Spirochaetaceae bacterium]